MKKTRVSIEIPVQFITSLTRVDLQFFLNWAEHYTKQNLFVSFANWLGQFALEQHQLRQQADHEPGSLELPALTTNELAEWLEATYAFCRQPNTESGAKFIDQIALRVTCLASRILSEMPKDFLVQVPEGDSSDE